MTNTNTYLILTAKIELLDLAEARASDPVMKKMWRLKSRNLFEKRTEWLQRKCQSFKRTKAE